MDVIVTPFELVIGALVGLAILALWLFNRSRDESHRLPISHELLTVLVSAAAIAAVLTYRSRVITREPLLFIATAGTVVTFIAVVTNLIMTRRMRQEMHDVSGEFGRQMTGLGNLQFYPTKDETMEALAHETHGAKEKLIATRFSPADISVETDYWATIKQRAFDPSILYIRIHCLAHMEKSAITGVCRLIEELRGAQRFQLAIAMFNNSFEIIIADERECIFCFNDLSMTIRNGFRLDSVQPNSARVVANFDSTLRSMLEDCHIIVDFGEFVQTAADVRALQSYLKRIHEDYRGGRLPRPIHTSEMEEYLRTNVFQAVRDG